MELRDQDGTLLMSVGKTGGPAFPTRAYDLERQTWVREEGMTLRDYFAAKALHAEIITGRQRYDLGLLEVDEWRQAQQLIAGYAYDMADAMLKARTA
jgi:hypothetical protein